MIITITTTLQISEQNTGLIPFISSTIGYEDWKKKALAEDENADVLYNTFMKYFLEIDYSYRLKHLIAPAVDNYFGVVMKDQADIVKTELDSAIDTVVEITE
jgi:hypothetical protein